MTLDEFVGLPYREGARGPEAYDCYGLVATVFRTLRGVELPDWYQQSPGPGAASRTISAALRGEVDGGLMERVETPEDFDIAVAGSSHHPHHVGVVVSGGVLHAARASGSVWQPLPRFLMIYPQTEYYRWHR